MSRSLPLLFFLVYIGCASIQPPPGGPEDKTPPALDTVMPHQRQLNVQRDAKLHFIFKTNIDRSSFMNSLSITPYLSGVVKYKWSGYDEVIVVLPEQLRENTTYVVGLSKDLKTRRNGPLTDPIQIVFSTGNIIDTGHIAGTMLPPLNPGAPTDLSNISIFAYDITDHSLDTLHFDKTRPDFITQPSSKGAFEFKAMKVGHSYRMFALIDEFRNKVFDPGIDAFGVANKDVTLDVPEKSDIHIRMAPKSDSVKPSLQDAEITDAYHIRARFSEAIDSASVRPEAFVLKDSITGNIPILSAFRDNIERKPGIVTILVSKPLEKGRLYLLDVLKDQVHDLAGNQVSDSSPVSHLSSSSIRDTFPPPRFIGFEFPDSSKGLPQDLDLQIHFTDAVDTAAIQSALRLVDSTKKVRAVKYRWIDGNKLSLHVMETLQPLAFYDLRFDEKLVRSPLASYASKVKDTLIHFRFFTGDEREFGTISGEVTLSDSVQSKDTSTKVTVQLLTSEDVVFRVVTLPFGKRSYLFDRIPRGKYRVRGWISTTASGKYDPGSVIPFRFGAPSGDYPDLIDVRPRWALENIKFEIH
ncbi:MAG: Ig-like domain-containing protein [Bacteroidota bacterium]|nr:Ig-like domain-containing protein [Bacteroidota bacterium]